MTELKQICSDLLKEVASAKGAAIIHLDKGSLMASAHTIPNFDEDYLNTLTEATVDMFRGKTAQTAEAQLRSKRGKDVKGIIHEFQVATANTCYFMTVIPDKPSYALVLITGKETSLGAGWAAVKQVLPKAAAWCP